jgi:hypothetical protein
MLRHICQVQEPLMLEAASGQCWTLDEAPYGAIEFLWNHVNFWACLQVPEDGWQASLSLAGVSFDLADTQKWERLFLDPQDDMVSMLVRS